VEAVVQRKLWLDSSRKSTSISANASLLGFRGQHGRYPRVSARLFFIHRGCSKQGRVFRLVRLSQSWFRQSRLRWMGKPAQAHSHKVGSNVRESVAVLVEVFPASNLRSHRHSRRLLRGFRHPAHRFNYDSLDYPQPIF